ncbi:MAG TPA: NAD(P)/FAD-dependent oxidoreductase, partial [Polyangiaceae bacterium]|nr:NAD(P)/FAD-dependent oxidoreductase [Polyangiaceae bacterium]
MYDVVVIGAGPAGLLVAEQLEREGSEVLVLEAGPREFDTGPEVVSDPAWAYRPIGARCWWPRALAVGGRTNVWGGWLARFGAEVFEDGHWPYGARELAPYYAAAEAWLGATDEPLDPRVRRAARALGLRARGRRCARDPAGGPWRGAAAALAPRVRVNSVALRIDAGPDGAAVQVLRAGCCETLHARAVILAASPIETTRLLLASGVRHAWLGRRLTDHSNLSYILLEPARSCSNEGGSPMPRAAFVPRVVNRRGTPQRRYRGGFSLEIVGPVPVNRLDPEVRALFPALPPDSSYTFVNALGEQRRHTQRFIDLAPRARDALGRRLPRIHLAWSAGERRMIDEMKATCRSLARELASPGAELLPFRD